MTTDAYSYPRFTLRALASADHPGAAWCASICAGTAWRIMPTEGRTALRLLWLWAQGVTVSTSRLLAVSNDAADAAVYADAYDRGSRTAIWAAVHAARVAASVDGTEAAYNNLLAAINWTAQAVAARDQATPKARERHLSQLGERVEYQVTPLDPRRVDHPLRDWALERTDPSPYREGSLGESLAWGRQHRLRWWLPQERLLAERRIDVPHWHRRTQ